MLENNTLDQAIWRENKDFIFWATFVYKHKEFTLL